MSIFGFVCIMSAIVFFVLFFVGNGGNRMDDILYALSRVFVIFVCTNLVALMLFYPYYKSASNHSNMADNVYCPPTVGGSYSGLCTPAYSHIGSFLNAYVHGDDSDNPNYVDVGNYGHVLRNKKTGDLYLEVNSQKLNGKDSDMVKQNKEDMRSEYIKFSDIPKVFDSNIDINKLADGSINLGNKKFSLVTGFKRDSKEPIITSSEDCSE